MAECERNANEIFFFYFITFNWIYIYKKNLKGCLRHHVFQTGNDFKKNILCACAANNNRKRRKKNYFPSTRIPFCLFVYQTEESPGFDCCIFWGSSLGVSLDIEFVVISRNDLLVDCLESLLCTEDMATLSVLPPFGSLGIILTMLFACHHMYHILMWKRMVTATHR